MKKTRCFIESFLEWCYDYAIIVVPVAILSISLVVVIAFGTHCYNLALQKGIEDYNNGICRECGEPFEYKGLPEADIIVMIIISVLTVTL